MVQMQSTVVHGVNSLLKKHITTHDSVQENDEYSCCWPCNMRFLTTEMLLAARWNNTNEQETYIPTNTHMKQSEHNEG